MAGSARRLVARIRTLDRVLVGQGIRYAVTGAGVACVYILTTLFLANVVGIHFQVALALGFFTAVTTHFFAHRFFVWGHDDFALSATRQASRYVPMTIAQYAFTALTTSVLPSALGVPTDLVYLVTVVCVTVVTFVLLRTRVFHAEEHPT
jgi:putative flippase GtrA